MADRLLGGPAVDPADASSGSSTPPTATRSSSSRWSRCSTTRRAGARRPRRCRRRSIALLAARLDRLARGRARGARAGLGGRARLPRGGGRRARRRSPSAARARAHLGGARAAPASSAPHAPSWATTTRYRFQHILIRDAAYRRLLKRARARAARAVRGLGRPRERRPRAASSRRSLGYHLEQAHRYLAELGAARRPRPRRSAAARPSGWPAPGRRAFARGDMPAAANLLRRAATCCPRYDPDRLGLLPDLGEALMDLGEFAEAEAAARRGDRGRPTTIGDHRLARRRGLGARCSSSSTATTADWARGALREAPARDPGVRARRRPRGPGQGVADHRRRSTRPRCRYGEAAAAVERAIEYARRGRRRAPGAAQLRRVRDRAPSTARCPCPRRSSAAREIVADVGRRPPHRGPRAVRARAARGDAGRLRRARDARTAAPARCSRSWAAACWPLDVARLQQRRAARRRPGRGRARARARHGSCSSGWASATCSRPWPASSRRPSSPRAATPRPPLVEAGRGGGGRGRRRVGGAPACVRAHLLVRAGTRPPGSPRPGGRPHCWAAPTLRSPRGGAPGPRRGMRGGRRHRGGGGGTRTGGERVPC